MRKYKGRVMQDIVSIIRIWTDSKDIFSIKIKVYRSFKKVISRKKIISIEYIIIRDNISS